MKFLLYCILSISVCLTVFGQNTPVIETIEDLSIPEGMVHDLSVSASDPDAGDELTFQVYNLPDFASFSQGSTTTGNINIQTGFADAGQYTITVRVTDLQLNYAEESFILTIEDNQPKASTQELLNFNYTINAGGSLDFYVYYPQNYDANPNDQPVLIYLHGLGMRGGSPTKLISSENDGAPSHYVANGGDLPMMVITPHQPVWIGGVSYSTWNIPLLKELIEHVKSTFNVDQDRIYLTGFSNGGQSAWQYAIEYKEDLAALIPVAGRTNLTNQSLYGMNLQDPEYACQISDLPTNVWHSFNDEVINIGHATNMVESINNCNPAPDPVPLLHVLSGVSHGGTRPHVYGNITGPDNIYNWMLSYVRGVGFVDTDPPVFVDGTPSVSNVLDVSFDFNASIDEVGTVYYALYSSNENPNIEEIISGSGSSIITYGSLSNVQSSSRLFSDLDPETTYYLWTVAEDAVSPPNRQASPTLLTVTTQEEIIDDQPPVFETQPTILDVGAGSVRLNLEINEEGTIYWGLFDPDFVPSPGDLLSSGNGIQFGSFGTNGSTESLEITGLFKGTDYKLGVLAVDDEPNPNEQATVFTLTFSTDSLEEGVIPDRKYLINITAGSSPSNEFGWNDLGLDGFSGSKQFSGLVDSQEIPGQLSLTAYNGEEGSSINDIADNGSGYANGSIFPPEVVRYGAYTTGWGIIDFINLDPDKYYSFNILGSRNASGSRTTDFLLGGETLSLESVNNLSSTVTFEKLSPPSNGIMRLRFDPGSSNWGYINLIEVEEYNQLSGDTLSPVIQPDVSVAQIDDLEVEITWAGSTDPDLAGYSLYRSLDAEPSSDLLTDLLQGNIQGNTYLDTAVTVGQQYFYWVVAIDSAGNYSSRSAFGSVLVISSDTIAPQQPVGLVAEIIEADRITLSWDANPEPDISGYMIARGLSVDFDFESEVIDEYVNSVTYLDTLLSDETTYYYKIKAVDLSGNQSVASEVLQVTTLDGTPPALPDTVLLTATTDAIEVSWSTSSSADVAGYNLFRTIAGTSIVYDTVANNPIEALTKTLYIPFENNLSDQSGNGIISSASGGLTFTDYNPIEGDFSGQFDGVDDQIILDEGDVYVHESFSTKSVLLWVNATTISGVQDIYDEGGSTNGMGLRINEGMLEGVVQDNHNIQMVSTPIDIGVWTHVALVYNQGTLMIYKNGELSDSQSTPYYSISTHSDAGGLGGTISSNAFDVVGNNFNGRIDEFMVIPSGLGSTTLSSYYKYYNPVIDTIAVSIDTLLASDLGVYDTVFVDDTPEAGIEYGYFLSATDSSGNESAYSVPVYGMLDSVTFDPPSVPQNLQAVLSGTDMLDLSWDEVTTTGLSHYTLYRFTSPFTTAGEAELVVDSVLTTSYSDVSLTQETTYYYRVSATNIEGETSGLSGIVSYLIPDTESPLAPVNLVVAGDTARVSISWQDGGSSDVVGYNIYRNVGAAPTVDSAYFYAQASGTSYIDFGVSELTTYYYVVAAYDEVANESVGSAPGTATPQNVTAPSSPAGVISTLTGDTEITINWDANTESDLQGYRLYRGMTPGFAIEGNLLVDNVTDLSYIDEGLKYETTYYYYVTSFDVAGNESIVGLQASSTTNVEVALPTVPQNLQAVLSGTDVLDLSWDEVTTAGLSHYTLYRSTSPFTTAGEAELVVDSVLTASYSDVSLTQETTYYYRVSATNIEGETSGLSGMVSYLIPDTESPLVPVNLVVAGDTARVTISWQDGGSSDVVGYNIYRNVGAAPTVDSAYFYAQASGTSYTDFGVSELTTYYYVVAAYDEVANESVGSVPDAAAPQNVTAPSSPVGVISTLTGDTEITINWDANTESDLQGYRLYRGMTPGFAIEGNLLVDNVTDLSYIDEGLEYETTYYYYVTAFDVAGNESIVGLQASSTTNVEPVVSEVVQTVMVNLTETGSNSGQLSWNDLAVENIDKAQTFSLLTDSLGVPTTIAFTVYNGQLGSTINNVADNGGSLNGGVYPDLVARYGAYTTNRGVMAFQNLDINHEYDITLLSGRAGSGSRITTIEVNQEEVQYVESIDNNQNTVTFRSVTPAPDGTIEIRFSKENSNWGYLNAVVLHKYDAGMAGARVLSSTEGEQVEDVYEERDILEDLAINTELDNQSTDFTLFPNPVVDKLVIRFEKPLSKSTTLIVRSINGQKLEEIFLHEGKSNFEIDLSYPTGIYHLTIPLDKGIFISEKVFVE